MVSINVFFLLLLLLIKIYTSVWFSSAGILCHGWSLKELSGAPACSVYSGLGNRLNWDVTLKKKLAKLIVPTVKANVHYILPQIAVSANSLKDVFFFFLQILVIETLCIKENCILFDIYDTAFRAMKTHYPWFPTTFEVVRTIKGKGRYWRRQLYTSPRKKRELTDKSTIRKTNTCLCPPLKYLFCFRVKY